MDPIITKLNQQIIQKVNQSVKPVDIPSSGASPFQTKFDEAMAEKMLNKIQEDYGWNTGSEMTVLSAENVNVTTKGAEFGEKGVGPGEKYFDMFKEMNRDLLSLDATLEVLTTPGVKITPRQLLACQAGIANATIMAEGFSRFTTTIAQGIQTLVSTQV